MANYTKLPLNLSLLSMHLAFPHRTLFLCLQIMEFYKERQNGKTFCHTFENDRSYGNVEGCNKGTVNAKHLHLRQVVQSFKIIKYM